MFYSFGWALTMNCLYAFTRKRARIVSSVQYVQFAWSSFHNYLESVSHIINSLLTSFARSVQGKYRPLGLGSTDLAAYCQDLVGRYFPGTDRANEVNKIYV